MPYRSEVLAYAKLCNGVWLLAALHRRIITVWQVCRTSRS